MSIIKYGEGRLYGEGYKYGEDVTSVTVVVIGNIAVSSIGNTTIRVSSVGYVTGERRKRLQRREWQEPVAVKIDYGVQVTTRTGDVQVRVSSVLVVESLPLLNTYIGEVIVPQPCIVHISENKYKALMGNVNIHIDSKVRQRVEEQLILDWLMKEDFGKREEESLLGLLLAA